MHEYYTFSADIYMLSILVFKAFLYLQEPITHRLFIISGYGIGYEHQICMRPIREYYSTLACQMEANRCATSERSSTINAYARNYDATTNYK